MLPTKVKKPTLVRLKRRSTLEMRACLKAAFTVGRKTNTAKMHENKTLPKIYQEAIGEVVELIM